METYLERRAGRGTGRKIEEIEIALGMKRRDGKDNGQNAQWLCIKWPSSEVTSGGCKLELPWVFKTVKKVGILAIEQIERIKQPRPYSAPGASGIQGLHRVVRAPFHSVGASNSGAAASISKSERRNDFPLVQQFTPKVQGVLLTLGQMEKKEEAGSSLSKEEPGELEQRALAQALARRKPATILEFYSPRCKLCRSLMPVVAEVESRHEDWLHVVMADVENKRWLPEVKFHQFASEDSVRLCCRTCSFRV